MIAEFCKTGSGGTPSRGNKGDYFDGNIPWIKSGELRDQPLFFTEEHITEKALKESSAKLVPPGAVLIAMYGATVGRTALLEIEAATNQAICFVVPDYRIALDRYVWYGLRASYNDLLAKRMGGAQPNISQQIVRATKLLLPPMSEQAHIVEILDEADRLRRLRREADTKAARILPALFIKMFGDPATNPMGWPIANLETVSEIISGATKGRQLNGVETVELPYMRVANVKDGYLDLSSIKTIKVRIDEVDKYSLRSGDLLMTEGGDPDKLGRTAIWSGEVEICLHQNHIFKVRVKREIVLPEYLRELIGSPYGKTYFLGVAKKTTGIATINRTQLGRFPVLIPPINLQTDFVAKFSQLRLIESHQINAAKAIESLFSELLQRAFSGQLTAKWREAHIKELLAEMEQQARLLNLPLHKEFELTP